MPRCCYLLILHYIQQFVLFQTTICSKILLT
uniref:Uncharacterized protein n=1 Tax=Podoviridae sp. ctx0K11 TaxID=2825287 RepID=A0A8S5QGH2_9CAUD|nr:MAG TPA: hypothetical protein [Podoviridae sp. ctx0K11]DAI27867.1 MAG TPA: hypothetical protein [Caudoviricetes sp.]